MPTITFDIRPARSGGYDAYYGKYPLGNYNSIAQAESACKGVENFLYASGQPVKATSVKFENKRGNINALTQDKYKGLRKVANLWYITSPKRAPTHGFADVEEAIRVRASIKLMRPGRKKKVKDES